MPQTEHDMRCCVCADAPIMAKYGMDTEGRPYVHVKAWKGNRLIVEVVQTEGVVRIRCRKCLHWHKVTIRGRVPVQLVSEELPLAIQVT